MNTEIKRNEIHQQWWTLLGPCTIASIILIMSLRPVTASWILPLGAIGGLFASHYWKWRGLLLASVVILATLSYQLFQVSGYEILWNIALAASMFSAFVLTVLSSEETHFMWDQLLRGGDESKQVLAVLSDQLKIHQTKSQAEKQEILQRFDKLQKEMIAEEEKCKSSDQLVNLIKGELTANLAQQEKLLQEASEARQMVADLEYRLDEIQGSDEFLMNQKSPDDLRTMVAERDHELEELKLLLDLALKDERESRQKAEGYNKELIAFRQIKQHEIHEIQASHQATIQGFNQKINAWTSEQQLLNETIVLQNDQMKKLESSFPQERLKFEERIAHVEFREQVLKQKLEEMTAKWEMSSRQLNDQQFLKEIIASQNEMMEKTALSIAQEKAKFQETSAKAESQEQALKQKLEEMTKKWAISSQQLVEWQHKAQESFSLEEKVKELQTRCESEKSENLRLQEALDMAVVEKQQVEILVQDDREIRRLEGLYNQLRQQFEEKSKVLDVTRRELFESQEKLLALHKELDESNLQNDHEIQKRLSTVINTAEREIISVQREYEQEVAQLHELIESLMAKA